MKKDIDVSENNESNGIISNLIRAALITSLLTIPAGQGKGEYSLMLNKEQIMGTNKEVDISREKSLEHMAEYERIFKDGIRKALEGLDAISQIPLEGKEISYYRDTGSHKGKKLTPENIHALHLPETFDIQPRRVTIPISSMMCCLGKRKFQITPDAGKIKDIYLTPKKLVIETTLLFDVTYDKQQKLPDLLFRLRMTPVYKGEKKGFKRTIIKEI